MRYFISFALVLFLGYGLNAQVVSLSHIPKNSGFSAGTDFRQTSGTGVSIINLYVAAVTHPNDFINGKEFMTYFYRSKTSPFIFSGNAVHATLYFNNRKFENVTLQYDTFLDELVYTDTSRILNYELPRISLNKDLVEAFTFNYNGEYYDFRYLRFTSDIADSPADGFFQVVYDGPSKFIIKHRSTEYVRDAITEYKYSDIKYLLSGNKFLKVSNLKDFLSAFGDKSGAVKDYIQKERIRFRKADNDQISGILRFYDDLVKG